MDALWYISVLHLAVKYKVGQDIKDITYAFMCGLTPQQYIFHLSGIEVTE